MLRRNLLIALTALVMLPFSSDASYTIYGSGSGTAGQAISASAELSLTQYNFGSGIQDALQITLTNTAPTTSYRGNLLTGFFFSLSGVGDLTTSASGFDGLATTVRNANGTTTTNKDIAPAVNNQATDGGYQLSNGPFGTANSGLSYSAYEYGIGTVGYGLTGFSGAATEGDNYGIAAPGSDLTLDGLPQALPVIDTKATFWILKPAELTNIETQLVNARFVYGSLPDNALTWTPPTPVPEPSTFLLVGAGLGCLAFLRKKRTSA